MSEISAHAMGALDPDTQPQLLYGVRTRRTFAFLVDCLLITGFTVAVAIGILFFGLLTLGVGFLLYFFLWPGAAILYYALSLCSRGSATPGMRLFGVRLVDLDGFRPHPIIAIAHPVLFWFFVGLAPVYVISLVIPLFDAKKRMLHDLILQTMIVRSDETGRFGG